jgi:NAD(P)-dependent dehydrogenase (short-subunit alcohol dehydrogenase family)
MANLPLAGKVAVVAGATRGAGRGIAVMLGEAGAVVYCTGRSVRGNPSDLNRKETIEETAEMVSARGGTGIPVRVDHTDPAQVQQLFERIGREQNGRLDIVINDIWGGEQLAEWGKTFWEHSLDKGLLMQDRVIRTHLITSYYAAPLMIAGRSGLIVEVTDGTDYRYRGNLYYSLAKIAPIHLAASMAEELRPYNIAAVSVTPGFLRSEEMLDYYGVTEDNWMDAVKSGLPHAEHFAASETPYFVGRAIAALAADPDVMDKSGQALSSWELSDAYGFSDVDGRQPHWGNYSKSLGI